MINSPDTIPFTRDMAESLLEYFDRFEDGGVVEIYQNHQGLWFWNDGQPLFLELGRGAKNGKIGSKTDDRKHQH